MKFLLIENDLVDLMAVRRLFQKNFLSNRLYVAESGLEALAFLREHNYQSQTGFQEHLLILLDLEQLFIIELELLTQLQSDSNLKKFPIIGLTAFKEMKNFSDTKHLNLVGYLSKPFTFSELSQLMRILNQNGVFESYPLCPTVKELS